MSSSKNDRQNALVTTNANPIQTPTRLHVDSIPTIENSRSNSAAERRKRRKAAQESEEGQEDKRPLEELPEDQDSLADDAIMHFKTTSLSSLVQETNQTLHAPTQEVSQSKADTTPKKETSKDPVKSQAKAKKVPPRQSNDSLDIPLGDNQASSIIPIQPLRENQPHPTLTSEEKAKVANKVAKTRRSAPPQRLSQSGNISQVPATIAQKKTTTKKKKRKKRKATSLILAVALGLLALGGVGGAYYFWWRPYSAEQDRLRQESLSIEQSIALQQQYQEVISRIQHATAVNDISNDVLVHLKTLAVSSYLVDSTTGEITRDEAHIQEGDQALYFLDNLSQYDNAILLFYLANTERFEFVKAYPERADLQVAPEQLSESLESVPALLQWDVRWGYEPYGDSTVYYAGCAPTSLSMVMSYLLQNPTITPAVVKNYSDENGYYVSGAGTSNQLLTDYAEAQGVNVESLWVDQDSISQALQQGQVLIFNMMPGIFTQTGHFIVVTGEENGQLRVLDPNSISRSRLWSYEEVLPEMLAVWAYSR